MEGKNILLLVQRRLGHVAGEEYTEVTTVQIIITKLAKGRTVHVQNIGHHFCDLAGRCCFCTNRRYLRHHTLFFLGSKDKEGEGSSCQTVV